MGKHTVSFMSPALKNKGGKIKALLLPHEPFQISSSGAHISENLRVVKLNMTTTCRAGSHSLSKVLSLSLRT